MKRAAWLELMNAPPVQMTPAQHRAQDQQVQWLQQAVAEQQRRPRRALLDPKSLRLPQTKENARCDR